MTAVHIIAGIYLVQGATQDGLPSPVKPFWSISDCLSTMVPGTNGLSWTSVSAEKRETYRKKLGLSVSRYQEFTAWTDNHFNDGDIGWPDVFLSVEAALECREKFLALTKNIKLLMLAVPPDYLVQVMADQVDSCGDSESGLVTQLKKQEPVPTDGWLPRGYEILGSEMGGQFHSFVCNHLADDYQAKLGITFNAHGLIESLDDAVRAADYTESPEVGAEPVPWLPWLVLEYATDAR